MEQGKKSTWSMGGSAHGAGKGVHMEQGEDANGGRKELQSEQERECTWSKEGSVNEVNNGVQMEQERELSWRVK